MSEKRASNAAEREVLRSLVVAVRFVLAVEAHRSIGTELSATLAFLREDVERYWKEWHAEYDATNIDALTPPEPDKAEAT